MDEIRHLSGKYYQAFADARFTTERFKEAASRAEKEATFFPKIKDIFEADKHIQQRNYNLERAQSNDIEDWDISDIETQHGKEQIANIWDILGGKVSPKEGEEKSRRLLEKFNRKGKS